MASFPTWDFTRSIRRTRTLKGFEVMNMLRKGRVAEVKKGDVLACTEFVSQILQ